MSKELTPEMREQIEKEYSNFVDNEPLDDDHSWKAGWIACRSKSITEIQELREENEDLKDTIKTKVIPSYFFDDVNKELEKRDQKIAAMSEYIKEVEKIAWPDIEDYVHLRELRDKAGL